MKTQSLFFIFFVFLAVCACENPLMAKLMQPKIITFESNGGSYVPPQTVLKKEKISQPPSPAKTGFSFDGWYIDNVSFSNKWDFDDIPEGDMTLYASWHKAAAAMVTPTLSDFRINGIGTFEYNGNTKVVTITPYEGKTTGRITVYYQQVEDGTFNDKTSVPPSGPGKYNVTFDVVAAEGWNPAYELEAGMLIIQITNANGLGSYLNTLSGNNESNPHHISLNISNSNINELSIIKNALYSAGNKYVILDLSGSTITEIPEMAFTTYTGTATEPDNNPDNYIECKTLTGIIIPNTVKTIELGAFAKCINLKDVTIPNSVENIGKGAFAWCSSLNNINLPDSVKSIEDAAFYYCTSLQEVNIPINVKSIGNDAFASCNSLTKVTFDGTIPQSGWPAANNNNVVFLGDLRNKYLGNNGGPGTYTRSGNGTQNSPYTWARQ